MPAFPNLTRLSPDLSLFLALCPVLPARLTKA